uniref:Anoctamin n=1 Tax=Amphilophus citrinellus TaxID=61819 RepID=A0A3Q0T7S0_AMPCI
MLTVIRNDFLYVSSVVLFTVWCFVVFKQPTQRTFDYVLVANKVDDEQKSLRQEAFIEQLKKKNIAVTMIPHHDKVFYGLRAPNDMFEDYQYLLKVSDSCNCCGDVNGAVPQTTRIRIVHFILHQTFINTGGDAGTVLICLDVFSPRRSYFGEKVALYYLWLTWYTKLLVPAAVLGVVVFLYGLAFFNTNPLINEVCHSNITMCPRCDKKCKAWQLSDSCTYAKVTHLFDNEGTVAFAMYMAIWATLFLELWKRHRANHVSQWKVYDWSEEEEELIVEIVNDPDCNPKRFRHSYLQSTLVLILLTLMLMLIIGLAHALVVFRVIAAPLMSESKWEFLSEHANLVAVMLGAVLHYVTIQIMTRVNRWVSLKLCEIGENQVISLLIINSIKIYTAEINGHPGNYVRIAGVRLEECHPSGCMTDLFIQMAVIMLLKQTLNNIVEFTGPWLKRLVNKRSSKKLERKCGRCYRKSCRDEEGRFEPCDICKLRDWLRNYHLVKSDAFSLFNEFLEIVIQFSFTTIFVAAFPLAPLLALINNIFEIRLDAIKMVRLEQRLVPKKTNDIGVWTELLEVIGVLAVIANGLVIGVTSDFIPRLVYRYRYGPCAKGFTHTDCMEGYINDTLSTAFMDPSNSDIFIDPSERHSFNVTLCSYRDYRSVEDHSLTSQFWLVLAVRFAFVILFEHVLVLCKFIAAWFIPDNSTRVNNERLHDKLTRLKKELRKRSRSTDV